MTKRSGDRGGEPARTPVASTRDLVGFREELYGCLRGWGDALFELCDATLWVPAAVHSVPALSLEPVFRRSHGSLYKALARGSIDTEALQRCLVARRPSDWPLIFAVDASAWDRCDAECSPERGFYYSASKHSAGQPIVAGWSYQWIVQLGWDHDSWVAPVDALRIPPNVDATSATIEQIRRLVDLLPGDGVVPLFVFDAGYDPIAISAGLEGTRASVLVRIRSDRVFYAAPDPPSPGRIGRPRRHGRRFALSEPDAFLEPDACLTTSDPRYGTVRVCGWSGLHPKLSARGRWAGQKRPPIVAGTVIRVEVEHLPRPRGALKVLWLWWSGPGTPDLHVCWRAYLRRFDIEHCYRFAKQTLGWTAPALRTPEQADRWTWLIVAAYTQLRLARGAVEDLRLPWERPRGPTGLTPARVRRGFRRLHAIIGSPAAAPKSQVPGPGRPKGTRRGPRTRYPAIKKTGKAA